MVPNEPFLHKHHIELFSGGVGGVGGGVGARADGCAVVVVVGIDDGVRNGAGVAGCRDILMSRKVKGNSTKYKNEILSSQCV